MGDAPQLSSSDSMVVMWHAADADEQWDVQAKKLAQLKYLEPGEEFDYRVRRAEKSVFKPRSRWLE